MTELTHIQLLELKEKIEDALEDWSIKTYKGEPRTHLGISEIGEDCKRKLYYKFRWFGFEEFEGRMLRLFARGHREEEKYINYLEGIGCKVYRFDNSGKQFRMSGVMGHYGGSCDGVAITPWYPDPFILEFKTHNTKSFTHYVDKGLQISKSKHYDQMCGYGEKLQIQYGLYFPENKNDDDIKVTSIKLDWNRGKELEKKAEEIILAKEPPPRISENPAFWSCQQCFMKNVCHYDAIPLKNCRSCKNSMPTQDAGWTCAKYGVIAPDFIPKGCDSWMPI
jgi:hypothetical protein